MPALTSLTISFHFSSLTFILVSPLLPALSYDHLLRLSTGWIVVNLDDVIVGPRFGSAHRPARLKADPILSRISSRDALIGVAALLLYFAIHNEVIVFLDAAKLRAIWSSHVFVLHVACPQLDWGCRRHDGGESFQRWLQSGR